MKLLSFTRLGKPCFGAVVRDGVIDLTGKLDDLTTTHNLGEKCRQIVEAIQEATRLSQTTKHSQRLQQHDRL